jgi:hypothetical protein
MLLQIALDSIYLLGYHVALYSRGCGMLPLGHIFQLIVYSCLLIVHLSMILLPSSQHDRIVGSEATCLVSHGNRHFRRGLATADIYKKLSISTQPWSSSPIETQRQAFDFQPPPRFWTRPRKPSLSKSVRRRFNPKVEGGFSWVPLPSGRQEPRSTLSLRLGRRDIGVETGNFDIFFPTLHSTIAPLWWSSEST